MPCTNICVCVHFHSKSSHTSLYFYSSSLPRWLQRCKKCPADNNDGPSLLLSDQRFEQEQAMLAIAKASDCEAFHSATVVKITDADTAVEQLNIDKKQETGTTGDVATKNLSTRYGEIMVRDRSHRR